MGHGSTWPLGEVHGQLMGGLSGFLSIQAVLGVDFIRSMPAFHGEQRQNSFA